MVVLTEVASLLTMFATGYLSEKGKQFASSATDPGIPSSTVVLKQANLLTSRTGEGIGYELLIENGSQSDAIVTAIELDGRTLFIVLGGTSLTLERVTYEIEIDVAVGEQSAGATDFTVNVYDNTAEDWGLVSEGRLEYKMDTHRGENSLVYQLMCSDSDLI